MTRAAVLNKFAGMEEHDSCESIDEPSVYDPPRYGFKIIGIIGWIVLLAMLPLALIGSTPYEGEYRAMGLDIPDCDNLMPSMVAMLAFPVYLSGAIVNVIRWRRSWTNRIAALVCLMLCVAMITNVVRDEQMDEKDRAYCDRRYSVDA